MNKKLLAVAVAGILAAPLAAQAEVNIYGKMHLSVDSLDNDADGAANQDGMFVSNNSSFIGFKGSEDLGGGLKAIWQLEQGVDPNGDAGNNTFATRNSFVGLAGGFGAALIGRHDSPFKIVGRQVDLFGDQIGDARNITSDGGATWDLRVPNVAVYVSPNMNGFQGVLAYVVEDGTDDADAWSANATYSNGPLWVGLAYELHGEALNPAGTEEETGWRLGASYTMGAIKVTGLYQTLTDIAGVDGRDRDTYGLGAAYSFGNNAVKAQWYAADELDDTDETGANMWAIGLDHNFSKATTAYVAYAQTDNDDAATFSMAGGGHGDSIATTAGNSPSGFSVGLMHKF